MQLTLDDIPKREGGPGKMAGEGSLRDVDDGQDVGQRSLLRRCAAGFGVLDTCAGIDARIQVAVFSSESAGKPSRADSPARPVRDGSCRKY